LERKLRQSSSMSMSRKSRSVAIEGPTRGGGVKDCKPQKSKIMRSVKEEKKKRKPILSHCNNS